MVCKGCASRLVVKNGKTRGKQRYKCKSCSLNFVQGDARVSQETAVKRAFAVILYSLGKASYGFMAKLFGVTRPAVYRWIRQESARLNEPRISPNIQEIEFDDTFSAAKRDVAFCGLKKNKLWLIKAVDRSTRRTVSWVTGGRDAATFRKLYEKVKHLKSCTFYTDNWDAFAKILPPERHVIGKNTPSPSSRTTVIRATTSPVSQGAPKSSPRKKS